MTRKNTTKAIADDEVIELIEEVEVQVAEEITFSAKDLAAELLIDAKSFRRWLRAHTEDRANKGGRWIFSPQARDELLAAYRAKPVTEVTLADAD